MPDSPRGNGRQEWEELVPTQHSFIKYEESSVTILQAFELCDLPSLSDFGEDMQALQGKDDLSQVAGEHRASRSF